MESNVLEPRTKRTHHQPVSEVPACQYVDDEVDGGVEYSQKVSDGRVVVVPSTARPLDGVHASPEDVIDEGRGLADDEDTHDDDEHQGHVLLVPALAHLGPALLAALQGDDQLDVEETDEQERTAVNDDEVEQVGVKDPVDPVVAELAHLEDVLRSVLIDADPDAVVLEETRYVVDDRKEDDAGDAMLGLAVRVHLGRTERTADSTVPVHGHEYGDKHGRRVRYEIHRPEYR